MPENRRLRRLSTLLEFSLDAVLLSLFLIQAFLLGCLLTFGHVPIPNKLVESYLSGALPEDLSFQASSYQLRADGSIRVEAPSLRLKSIEKPIFESQSASLEIDFFSGAKFHPRPGNLVLSGGRLYLPAVYSPSGQRTPILEQISASLRIREDELGIESFAAMHETIRVRGSAFIPLAPQPADKGPRFEALARNFFNQANLALRETARIEGLKNPTLFFQLNHDQDGTLSATGRLTSRELNRADVNARDVSLQTQLKYTGGRLTTDSSVLFKAAEISSGTHHIRGRNLRALIDQEQWQNVLDGAWPNLELVADSLSLDKFQLEQPRLSLTLQNFPELEFNGVTSGFGGVVEVHGKTNLRARTATLRAKGSVNLVKIAGEPLPPELPSIVFENLPYSSLELDFSPGFALNQARVRTKVDGMSVNGIRFDHIRTSGSYQNGEFDFPQTYIRRDWQWLDLGLAFNRESMDYRVSLYGTAKPYDYNSILPSWWASIFEDFDFEDVENALGDFIIYGNAREPAADLYFGHARAENVAYKGVRITDGELFVRGRGPYAEIFDMDVRQSEGWARGSIRFSSRLDEVRGPESVRLDLQTKITLADARKLFDDNIAAILGDFTTGNSIRADLNATIFNGAYTERAGMSYVDVRADCPQPLQYKGLPLDHLSFQLFGRKDATYLRDLKIGLAGGSVDARADILTGADSNNEVRFYAELKEAHQGKIDDLLAKFVGKTDTTKTKQKAKDTGRLDLTLHARGPVDQVFALNGFGRFNLRNDNLAAIQLLGPVSALLQQARIGATTFTLDTMRANFELAGEEVDFKELRIDGPRTRIEAPGKLGLKEQTLDMRVSVSLFGNAGNPGSRLRKIGDFITSPIPNLLEFELTGTLDKQRFRSLYDPRNLLPNTGGLPFF